jgi:protein-arginine deiminase
MPLLLAGCSAPPPPIVDLIADTNRSGLLELEDPTEDLGEEAWSRTQGAVVLANLDDDDRDGALDIDDGKVNGVEDLKDLSPLAIKAWPNAPVAAIATLSVDSTVATKLHLFRVTGSEDDPASYQLVADPSAVKLTGEELQKGARFALEALTLVEETAWDGVFAVRLTVDDPGRAKDAEPLADLVQLRVAPLLLQHDIAPTEELFYTEAGQYTASLVEGILAASQPLGLPLTGIDTPDGDIWAQDYFDVGYHGKPGPNGTVHGMKIVIRSAQPDRDAGEAAVEQLRGPDFGVLFKHGDEPASEHAYSMNSFGNWSVIPPYDKGGESFPLGRNLWGATGSPRSSPDPVFEELVRAQKVQPEITVDSSWLVVGHVDEFVSFVKTNTPRGWTMLAADPTMAREMLRGLETSGMGGEKMFKGKQTLDWRNRRYVPAEIAIAEVLADADLMAASQRSQARIDRGVAKLKEEIGLSDDEIVSMPFLMEESFGGAIAYQPGTVNLLHFDGHAVIPDPFGPHRNGVDAFKADLDMRLGALGVKVFYADDWDTFHLGGGEVHCGTNAKRKMDARWWESGR